MGFRCESSRNPSAAPVAGSKALIHPLPKLPISSALLNVPKFAGARAIPHGEFKGPCDTSLCNSAPCGPNTSTKPCPSLNVVMLFVVLLRIGHVNLLADRLNSEGRIVAGYIRVSKRLYISEIRVIHLNLAVAEIRGIDERRLRSRNNRQPLVNRPELGVIDPARLGVVHDHDRVVQIGTRIPSC